MVKTSNVACWDLDAVTLKPSLTQSLIAMAEDDGKGSLIYTGSPLLFYINLENTVLRDKKEEETTDIWPSFLAFIIHWGFLFVF